MGFDVIVNNAEYLLRPNSRWGQSVVTAVYNYHIFLLTAAEESEEVMNKTIPKAFLPLKKIYTTLGWL